jgi:hypothetical protein
VIRRRSKGDDHLYLFHHVPKCAGMTFEQHVQRVLPEHAWVNLNQKIPTKAAVRSHVVGVRRRPDRLRSIHGHRVYFGLHEISRREPRYFTFLRDPVGIAASTYRYWADKPGRRDVMYRDGALIPFAEFIELPALNQTLLRALARAIDGDLSPGAPLEPPYEPHIASAKRFLDACWFVGFVDHIDEDLRYVVAEMGLPPDVDRKNTSRDVLSASDLDASRERILELNGPDLDLYDYARSRYGR